MSGRKLGRGLDMLIRSRPAEEPEPEADPIERRVHAEPPKTPDARSRAAPVEPDRETSAEPALQVIEVDPKSVVANPEQPRREFARVELENLKASIAQEGLLQPILVRPYEGGYQLVAGERRLRASQELDLQVIPAIVSRLEDERMLEIALIENIQRQDLSPIEVARAYRHLLDGKGWTQDVLARGLGLSRPSVANALRLLELPEDMQEALEAGHISIGHAKVLLSVEDEEERRRFFERVAEDRLSVRELEAARDGGSRERHAPQADAETDGGAPARPSKSRSIVALEEKLSRSLGTKVAIQTRGKKGRGKITIEFYSADDFERLRERLS